MAVRVKEEAMLNVLLSDVV
ncbi:hypothetical protein [Streptomyces sp. NPDC020965]